MPEGVQSFGGEAKPTSSTYTDNQDLQVVPDVDTIENEQRAGDENKATVFANNRTEQGHYNNLFSTTTFTDDNEHHAAEKKNEDYDDEELPAMPTGNTAEDERERAPQEAVTTEFRATRERKKEGVQDPLENAERETIAFGRVRKQMQDFGERE